MVFSQEDHKCRQPCFSCFYLIILPLSRSSFANVIQTHPATTYQMTYAKTKNADRLLCNGDIRTKSQHVLGVVGHCLLIK